MTFCFSFEVFMKLNPTQVNIKGGGLTYKEAGRKSVQSLWNNSLISISILHDYWLETMRDGHKHLLIYLDFPPEARGWSLFTVCFYGAKVSICILLEEIIR